MNSKANLPWFFFLIILTSLIPVYSQDTLTEVRTEDYNTSSSTSHNLIVGFIITIIVVLQIIVFLWTLKRIKFYQSGMDVKRSYRTIKIRIPESHLNNIPLESILNNVDRYAKNNSVEGNNEQNKSNPTESDIPFNSNETTVKETLEKLLDDLKLKRGGEMNTEDFEQID
jgi:hypothetical protein